MRHLDPKPDILRIEELVIKVKQGDIKLPKFQRPFVWKRDDILKLLDSVYNGYPIGSILLWLTMQKLASENKIGDLDINDRPEEYPTNYLLDGQQRLSTLCGALFWDGEKKDSLWNIAFDVDTETFLFPRGEQKINYFPLNKLINTTSFINQCKAFEATDRKEEYTKRAEKLLNSIKDYKLAAVTIGDMELDEVAPIFERINSSGRQLTMVDLMRAATWKGGFDLNDAINSVREACESKQFFDIPDSHILRNISACAGLGIHKEGIEKLRGCTSDKLKESSSLCTKSYKLAVDFLSTELPLTSIGYLPYGLQLSLLVEFFNLNSNPEEGLRTQLKKWFWKSAFTRYFGTANTGLITQSLTDFRNFARGSIESLEIDKELRLNEFLDDNFTLNKATSKTYALLLASHNPISLLTGASIDTGQALAVINRLEFHHIFPKAFLKTKGCNKAQYDKHSNICMLNLTNNREISDRKPSEYFPEIKHRLGDNYLEVLESNFINENAYNAACQDDYDEFIKVRTELLELKAKELAVISSEE